MIKKINDFSFYLKKGIQIHSSYSILPIEGLTWEYITYISGNQVYDQCKWDYNSHKEGTDIEIIDNNKKYNLSLKTNRIKNNKVSISSYRTTKFKTLEEKIEYIKNLNKSFDYYLLLLKHLSVYQIDYHVYLIPSTTFNCYEFYNWHETQSCWIYKNDSFTAKITKSMSDQLWYYFDQIYIKEFKLFDISIKKEKMGENFYKEIKNQNYKKQ